jgi:glycosyltransferase involved in cell wall biosynthesis
LNEPWGLVYIEAMLCKMPIVGINRNSFPELSGYGRFGKGIEHPDPYELADVIVNLLSNPGMLQQLGEAGQAHALNKFTWQQTVDKMLDVITRKKSKTV